MANITKIYDIKLTGQKELVNNMQIVNKSFDDAKKRFQELKAQIAGGGLNAFEISALKTEMEKTRLEMLKLKVANQELTNEGKAYTNALRAQKEEERQARNEKKTSLTEYQKLSKQLTELRNNAKEVAISFGLESKEFKEASVEVIKLDTQIKKIDSTLGQFQRNVGNYPKTINIGGVSQSTFNQLKNAGFGDLLGNQVNDVRRRVSTLNEDFTILGRKIKQARESGVGDLNSLEKEIINNRIEADKLNNEISQSSKHLNGLGSIGSGVFGKLNTDIKQLVLGYVGLQAAMSMVSSTIGNMKELSDQTTNLEVELGKAAGGANNVVNQLAKIDTRTKLTELENIANISVKSGVDESNLVGVTSAIDKIKIAFGKDFGDVEQGTESLVKLINIFEGTGNVNEDNLLRMGNAVRTLANESVASVPFLNDFSKRMAGLKGISDISLPSVLGLASGFEQFGQTAEVSSTALVKIIPKLANDTAKFAKVAGMTQDEFKKLLNSHPEQALIKVSEGLVKGKQDIEGISKSFADSELGSGRIASVLGVIGKNGDAFRKSIESAGVAYKDTSNLTDAFNQKNENFAATLDKIGKKFADLGNNKALQNLFTAIADSVLFLVNVLLSIPFGIVITGLTLLTAAWLYSKGATIQATLAQQWNNEQTLLGWVRLQAQRLGLIANTVATEAQTIATEGATVAQVGLNTAMKANPLGLILSLLALIIPLLMSFTTADETLTGTLKKGNNELKTRKSIQEDLAKSMKEQVDKTKASVDQLIRIIKDESSSLNVRKAAYEELIKIAPEFIGKLDAEYKATDDLNKVYALYITNLEKVARAQALKKMMDDAVSKDAEADKKVFDATLAYDNEKKENKRKNAKNERILKQAQQSAAASGGYANPYMSVQAMGETTSNKAQKVLDKAIKEKETTQKNLTEIQKFLNSQSDEIKVSAIKSGGTPTTPTTPTNNNSRGSRLTGDQKDYLKELEATRDTELAINEERYSKGEKTERDYLITLRDLNVTFYNQKIDYLKGKNAEELKDKAQASLAKEKMEKETNEKLFELGKKGAVKTFDTTKNNAQTSLNEVTDNPNSTPVQKDEAEQTYWTTVIDAQIVFNTEMDRLEKEFNQTSKSNAEERTRDLISEQSKQKQTANKLTEDKFKQVKDAVNDGADESIGNKNIEFEKQKGEILKKRISDKKQELQINKLNAQHELSVLNDELLRVQSLIRLYALKKTESGLSVEQQKELNALLEKEAEITTNVIQKSKDAPKAGKEEKQVNAPSDSNTQNLIKDKVMSAFNLDESKYGDMVGSVISQSFDIATQAMNNYFEAERQQVEASKQLAYERIDLEKEQLLAQAQSSAERDSIEKQQTEKKKQADKEAGQRLKKIKKEEAKIAFAMQLANIWSTVWQLGPVAGAVFGTILTGLATVQFAMTMANIEKAQFGKGGKFGSGGKLTGPTHDKNNGMPVINPDTGETQAYLEGDEGIINKKSMKDTNTYSVTGTPSQIASKINSIGGGVEWMGGASMKKFLNGGTYIGSNVQPPVFRSYTDSKLIPQDNQQSKIDLQEVKDLLVATNQTLSKEVNRKTIISSREMSTQQKEDYKQSEIATL